MCVSLTRCVSLVFCVCDKHLIRAMSQWHIKSGNAWQLSIHREFNRIRYVPHTPRYTFCELTLHRCFSFNQSVNLVNQTVVQVWGSENRMWIFYSALFLPLSTQKHLITCRMRVLIVITTLVALASAASISLEELEFHSWKLKFGKKYFYA